MGEAAVVAGAVGVVGGALGLEELQLPRALSLSGEGQLAGVRALRHMVREGGGHQRFPVDSCSLVESKAVEIVVRFLGRSKCHEFIEEYDEANRSHRTYGSGYAEISQRP